MSKHTAEAMVWITFWISLFGGCSYVDGKKVDLQIEKLKLEQVRTNALAQKCEALQC